MDGLARVSLRGRSESLGRAVLGCPSTVQENRLKVPLDTKYIGQCQHGTNTGLSFDFQLIMPPGPA